MDEGGFDELESAGIDGRVGSERRNARARVPSAFDSVDVMEEVRKEIDLA